MSEEPDLIRLLFRADWTRLRLAAEVTTSRDFDLDRNQCGADGSVPPPWLGAPGKPPRAGHVWEMATDQLGTRVHLVAGLTLTRVLDRVVVEVQVRRRRALLERLASRPSAQVDQWSEPQPATGAVAL